jgi:spermidine synthase
MEGIPALPDPLPRRSLALLFVSGACALGYQVLWVRQFSLIMGADAGTVGVVVGAFMGGMALGYLWASTWLARARRRLLAFGLIEGGIGLCALALGFAMPLVYRLSDVFYALHDGPVIDMVWRVGLTAVCLLPPTFLMGASFPAFFAGSGPPDARTPRRLSIAYALNLVGASFGALILGFILLEALGAAGSTAVLGLMNLVVGAIALLAARKSEVVATEVTEALRSRPERLPLVMGFTSGFLSLWFEVVWIRAIVPYSGSTLYALSLVLAVYLLGLGVGSRLVPRVARIGRPWMVGLILGLMGLGIGGADLLTHLWFRIDPDVSRLIARLETPMSQYWVDYPHVGLFAATRLTLLTTWPVAVMSGLLLPLLLRSTDDLGKSVGRLYGTNAAGCLAGSLLAQFVGLPFLGIRASLVSASVLALAVASVWVTRAGMGIGKLGLLAIAFAAVLVPPRRSPMRLFIDEIVEAETLFYHEDTLGSVTVVGRERWGLEPGRLLVNGHGIAGATGAPLLAKVPLSCVPDAQRIAVIGLGAGATCETAAMNGASVDCIEILPSVIAVQPLFRTLRNDADPTLTPPRVHYVLDDGRRFLHAASEPYDAIIVDGTQIEFEGGAALLTHEFFDIVAQRLKPGGLFVLWIGVALDNEHVMERTLLASFAWVAEWRQLATLLASSSLTPFTNESCAPFAVWSSKDLSGAIADVPVLSDDDSSLTLRMLRRREWASAQRIGRISEDPKKPPRASGSPGVPSGPPAQDAMTPSLRGPADGRVPQ